MLWKNHAIFIFFPHFILKNSFLKEIFKTITQRILNTQN